MVLEFGAEGGNWEGKQTNSDTRYKDHLGLLGIERDGHVQTLLGSGSEKGAAEDRRMWEASPRPADPSGHFRRGGQEEGRADGVITVGPGAGRRLGKFLSDSSNSSDSRKRPAWVC